jgi:hypothetical protein
MACSMAIRCRSTERDRFTTDCCRYDNALPLKRSRRHAPCMQPRQACSDRYTGTAEWPGSGHSGVLQPSGAARGRWALGVRLQRH